MKFLLLCLLSVGLNAEINENRFFKDITDYAEGFGLHTDLGYSSYLIELHSSEMDSAIDYDVLEATLGFFYAYDKWLLGTYGKFVVDEVQSNMFVVTTQASLNNQANIDKEEFGLYVDYTFFENDKESWGVNSIYRYASLDASDAYDSFLTYVSYFKYQTDGLALSLAYQRKLFEKGVLVAHAGGLYSKAKVNMSESINGQFQDSFVKDSVKALGLKVSLAYNYAYSNNLALHLKTDAWRQKFSSLKVHSHVGDTLPTASLKEASYTTYVGLAWRF
ncbi:MAG: Unknown protein [uncultured Sulfurovum sp.]|uniref:Uncharacterized protein n=1 Tax=uncultured Sulfurovum sp. TaxID=269237 RepID=A0A6S6S4R8_9BACT|nr:MAG: Unknown protein [uncultured Sulfurovum sp.]